jgi:hypothetical protein
MAALSQTAANVGIGSSGTRVRTVQAGEAITQGQPVYLSTVDSKYYKADANASVTTAKAVGIAITPAGADGWFVMQEGANGLVNLGATLTVGETYVVGATAGQVNPIGDLSSGHYPCILGTATTTALIQTLYSFTGVAKP